MVDKDYSQHKQNLDHKDNLDGNNNKHSNPNKSSQMSVILQYDSIPKINDENNIKEKKLTNADIYN